jgi:hypothetical protein
MSTFDLQAQSDHVRRHGDEVQWRRASKCPCALGLDPNRANPNCQVCYGAGFRYAAAVTLVGMAHGVHHEKSLLEAGIAVPGDMILSLDPLDPTVISDYDMIRLLSWSDGQPYDGDLVKRGAGSTDLLTYEPAEVYDIFALNAGMTAVVPYVETTDWAISGRIITWAPGRGPTVEQVYSVKYSVVTYDWVSFVSPMQRIETGTNLGSKILLRKRHLVWPGRNNI